MLLYLGPEPVLDKYKRMRSFQSVIVFMSCFSSAQWDKVVCCVCLITQNKSIFFSGGEGIC